MVFLTKVERIFSWTMKEEGLNEWSAPRIREKNAVEALANPSGVISSISSPIKKLVN